MEHSTEEIKLGTWREFEAHTQRLIQEARELLRTGRMGPTPVFRGQSNADWPLETTLQFERAIVSVCQWPMDGLSRECDYVPT